MVFGPLFVKIFVFFFFIYSFDSLFGYISICWPSDIRYEFIFDQTSTLNCPRCTALTVFTSFQPTESEEHGSEKFSLSVGFLEQFLLQSHEYALNKIYKALNSF